MSKRKIKYSFHEVELTLRKHEKRLLSYPNVLYLSIGEKIKSGIGKSLLAIRVFVSKKNETIDIGAIPKRLKAVKSDGSLDNYFILTDVEESSDILQTLALKGGDVIKRSSQGSIGFAFEKDGSYFLLTNAHVVLSVNEFPNSQIVLDADSNQLGSLYQATPLVSGGLHSFDAAIISPSVDIQPFTIGNIPSAIVAYGEKTDLSNNFGFSYFYQRNNGEVLTFHKPQFISTPKVITVEGIPLLFVNYYELTSINGLQPLSGDSGSALVRSNGAGLVVEGLVFAGGGVTLCVMAISDVFFAVFQS